LKNYKSVSGGKDIDALWNLQAAMTKPTPQWKAVYVPKDLLDDEDVMKDAVHRGPLAIKATAEEDESDDDMPPLQDVSDTDSDFNDSDDYEDSSDDDSEESDYDEEHEDELRELRKEAIDIAEDWFGRGQDEPEPLDSDTAERQKGNPFLKLLSSLRGRLICTLC
jgi:hypothetical protein